MKRFIAMTCAALMFASPALASYDYVVYSDYGGDMEEYMELAASLKEDGARVVINGVCASACLVLLHSDYGLEVCATQRAMLGYHIPWFSDVAGNILPDPTNERLNIAKALLAGMPPAIQKGFFRKPLPDVYKGAQKKDLLWVKGNYVARTLGACDKRR